MATESAPADWERAHPRCRQIGCANLAAADGFCLGHATDPYEGMAARIVGLLDEGRAMRRVSALLDVVEAACRRHRDTHPTRQSGCEMCDLRGQIAWDLLVADTEPTDA